MKIIHFSDLHYRNSGTKIQLLVDKIINNYKSDSKKPLIINSGDLVEDGRTHQMIPCKKILSSLIDEGFEMLLCPGNHDLKEGGYHRNSGWIKKFDLNFRDLLPNGRNFYGEAHNNLIKYPLVHQYGKYYFIGLNSNVGMHDSILARGELGNNQLKQLIKTIDIIKEKDSTSVVVTYLHHHPFKYKPKIQGIPGPWDYQGMKLKKRKQFLHSIKGKIDVLLFGHFHKYKRQITQEKNWDIKLIQLCAHSTHSKDKIEFSEIDLNNFTIKLI